jgi:hypothetical protein
LNFNLVAKWILQILIFNQKGIIKTFNSLMQGHPESRIGVDNCDKGTPFSQIVIASNVGAVITDQP